MKKLPLTATVVLVVFSLFNPQLKGELYLADGLPSLKTVDLSTGNQTTLAGIPFMRGLADYQGRLFGIHTRTGNTSIVELDLTTGAVVDSILLQPSPARGPIAIDNSGLVFLAGNNFPGVSGFWSASLTTGVTNQISSDVVGVDGMDFHSDGTLYAVEDPLGTGSIPNLVSINTATGEKTVIGSTGITAEVLFFSNSGLSFDENDVLHWAVGRKIYTLDTQTGAATFLTDLNLGGAPTDSYGLSFVNGVPEPGSFGLVLFFLATTGFGRRKN